MLADVEDISSGSGFTDRFNIAASYNLTATQFSINAVQCNSAIGGTLDCGGVPFDAPSGGNWHTNAPSSAPSITASITPSNATALAALSTVTCNN